MFAYAYSSKNGTFPMTVTCTEMKSVVVKNRGYQNHSILSYGSKIIEKYPFLCMDNGTTKRKPTFVVVTVTVGVVALAEYPFIVLVRKLWAIKIHH
jgi:hypothetical protein